jgi:hypothetical protein
MADIELVVIDADTKLRDFKDRLRWNDAAGCEPVVMLKRACNVQIYRLTLSSHFLPGIDFFIRWVAKMKA